MAGCWPSPRRASRSAAAPGRTRCRWTAGRRSGCPTGRSPPSPAARPAPSFSGETRASVAPRPGSGTGAARPASCGSTGMAPGSSAGCWPTCPGSWKTLAGSATGWCCCPTTRAGGTSTPAGRTAPTCAGTPTTATGTRAPPAPTAAAWGTSVWASSGCWTTWATTRSHAGWTSGWRARAPPAARVPSRRRTRSARSGPTTPAGPARSRSTAPCTGSPIGTGRRARSPTGLASAPASPACSAPIRTPSE